MFCDADFEGGICCNPGSNPAALRIQGITTPEDRNFVFYDPAAQALKLPALRAVVAEQGAFTTPALSACLFFVAHPAVKYESTVVHASANLWRVRVLILCLAYQFLLYPFF